MKEYFVSFPLSDKCEAITSTTILGNLAYQVDDGKDVKIHRHQLAELLGINANRFTYVHQHHSDIIMEVTPNGEYYGIKGIRFVQFILVV